MSALFLPAKHLMKLLPLDLSIMGTSLLITIVSLLRTSTIKDIKGNTLLLLALVAFVNNIVWYGLDGCDGNQGLVLPV